MSRTTRFTNGVTTALPTANLGQWIEPDYTKVFQIQNDFETLPDLTNNWTHTTLNAGTVALVSGAAGGIFGAITQTNAAGIADNSFLQMKSDAFLPVAGKKMWFKCRFKVSDATKAALAIGLQVIDTSPLAVTDGIWFYKAATDAKLNFVMQKAAIPVAGTNQIDLSAIDASGTIVADTFIVLGWYYDGNGNTEVYINDVKIYTFIDPTATYLPDVQLAISLGIQNGEAVAKVLTTDYVFAAIER